MSIALHEAAHALTLRAVGGNITSAGIFLGEGEGHVSASFSAGWQAPGERQWQKLLATLAGRTAEFMAAGRPAIDVLDAEFSSTDKAAIASSSKVLGRKSCELACGVLELALAENWNELQALAGALETRTPQRDVVMPTVFVTNHERSGPIVVTSRAKFDLPPRRDKVQEILNGVAFELPSWQDIAPKKRLFASQQTTRRVTRNEYGDVIEVVEEGPLGFERLSETLSSLTRSIEGALLDAVRPRRTIKTIVRDGFNDIAEIHESEQIAA